MHHTPHFSIKKIYTSDVQIIYIHIIYNFCQQSGEFSLILAIIDQLNMASGYKAYIIR